VRIALTMASSDHGYELDESPTVVEEEFGVSAVTKYTCQFRNGELARLAGRELPQRWGCYT
jgi:hypothetical protein